MTEVEIAELHNKIMELVDEGLKPISVSAILGVPLEMVYDVVEHSDDYGESYDDFLEVYDESDYDFDE